MKKEDWTWVGKWVQPTLSGCWWDNWCQGKNPYNVKFDGKYIIADGESFVFKKDIDELKKLIDQNENSQDFLKKLQIWIDEVHERCNDDIKDGNLVQTLKKFAELYRDMTEAWVFSFATNEYVSKRIEELSKKNNYDVAKLYLQIKPIRESKLERQNKEAKEIYKKMNGVNKEQISDELYWEIEDHVKKFESCGVHHFMGEPYSWRAFLDNYKKYKEPEQRAEEEIPKELEWFAKLASMLSYARIHMAETSGLLQLKVKPYLEKIGVTDHLWLSYNEIINYLDSGDMPNISARKEKVAIYSLAEKEMIVTGNKVDEIISLLKSQPEVEFPLKGRVANPGIVESKVIRIEKPDDISKVEQGDIALAHETTPEFVPALRKCVGIITELGGVTSHAAIISREFGIPCIVGAKGIMQLKDGDKVKLDGNTGMVHKA